MITLDGGQLFTIKEQRTKNGEPEFYAYVLCECNASFSSGEYMPSMRAAVEAARSGLKHHIADGQHAKELK